MRSFGENHIICDLCELTGEVEVDTF